MIKYQIFILDSILICLFWVRVGRACGVFFVGIKNVFLFAYAKDVLCA